MSRNVAGERAVVRNSDMDESMQSLAIELAGAALEKYTIEKDIASHIKKEFDRRYGPTWHCVVGRNFGSYVTHEIRNFLYFYRLNSIHEGTFFPSAPLWNNSYRLPQLRKQGSRGVRGQMLDNFFVTSPWSDGRSLIAKWTWNYGVDLHYFEKASIFYYSPLDEGFERTEIITQPITSFTLQNLRPETTYFICLRVHHRLQSTKFGLTPAPTTSTLTTTNRSPLNWHVRQPSTPVSPDNYAYEVRCTQATTQNWHLSALIGGILGVVFALMLGFLLLFVLKRNQCLPSSSSDFGKQMTQRSLLRNSYSHRGGSRRRGRKSSTKRGSQHSSLWLSRSSNSRSEFSGHLREEDEDDEDDDDDEVIAEDDEEDTEIDTGCKSSVRSQVGIYGGSGGTTGSSNRHSSMSSSIDAREDSSSVAMSYLPVNSVPSRTATRRSRDMKHSSMGYENIKNIYGVKLSVVTPTPEASGAKESLQKVSFTPVTTTIDVDGRKPEQNAVSPSVVPVLPDPLRESSIASLRSPLVTSPSPLTKSSQSFGLESDSRGACRSPVPLPEPQLVDLQTPILVGLGCKDDCTCIESPKIEAASQLLPDIPYILYDDEEENAADYDLNYESSLSLTDATSGSSSESIVSSNYDYEDCHYFPPSEKFEGARHHNPGRQGPSIYAEFIETI
ncbi:Dynein light chain 1, cytoplasmic [Echinococcus granulosus]|uniref:Dynein light chain 1, cytoplasmic n=1 Tax=Echinococcus granulosus TaxID=6210 RepID=A0A068WJG9_ECHGR|nr:Dynein light chain 1, cytoplasmic [Echinococcus granulosus]CDS17734.1 dynein light chain [Echinococcus granulosus]